MAKKGAKAKPKPRKPKKLVASARIKAAANKSAARAARGAPVRKETRVKTRVPDDTITLHAIYGSIPSGKVGLMLSMCGGKWSYRHVDLMSGAHKSPEFLAKNRWGQVPVLQHAGRFISQSNTILWYLANHYRRFLGRGDMDMWRIAEWLNWDLDFMASGLGASRAYAKFFPDTPQAVKDHARARGERALATLDRHLGSSKFMVGGAPTLADIAIFPWIATADEGGFTVADYPNVQAWAERMLTFPGVAHPYTILPKEDRAAA